jgi:MFS family permease
VFLTSSDGFGRRYFAVIFLVSVAMLGAQVTVTRLLSYKFYFHFVFLVISLAQLGIAGAGAWVFVLGSRLNLRRALMFGLLGIVVFTLLLLLAYAWLSPPANVGMAKINGYTAVPYLIALSLLMVGLYFCAGIVYSSLFSQYRALFNRLYASDLLGASVGCIASVALMYLVGPPKAFLLCGGLALLAGILVLAGRGRGAAEVSWWAAVAALSAVLIASWIGAELFDPNARYGDAVIEYEWNHLARTDRLGPGHYIIDGDASTWIIDPQAEIEYLLAPPNPRIAIIGVGAGPQLKSAVNYDPSYVLAVDINPSIINWSVGQDSEYNGGIFNLPQVVAEIDEGRHAVRSAETTFDLIGMHAVDTYAASAAGAYSLSENYLYTVEAFRDFFGKLSPQGLLATRRWLFYPPRENLRLFTTIDQALRDEGIEHPEDHLIVLAPVQDYRRDDLKEWGYILLARSPFTEQQLALVDSYVAANGWSYMHRPGQRLDTPFSEFAYTSGRDRFYGDYPYFVEPCYDANPFFFQFVPPFSTFYSEATASGSVLYNQSTDLLFVTLGVVFVLTLLVLGLPVVLRRRAAGSGKGWGTSTLYFASLGVGFMAIELGLIQIMALFLGHPTYALSIVLLGMLAFAGLGSVLVRRLETERARRMCLVICILAAVASLGLLPLIHGLIAVPFWLRVVVTLLALAAIAVPMGMPMATGIRLVGEENRPRVAWAWACNGGAAVVGTNLCMILMVYAGIPAALLVGAGCYAVAYVALGRLSRGAGGGSPT